MDALETRIPDAIARQPDFRRLVRHIDRTCGLFSMVFVIWDRADTEHTLSDAIRTGVTDASVERLSLPSADAVDIFHRIEEAGSRQGDVVVVEGLHRAFPERVRASPDDRPPILAALNLYRERLRRHPVCLVLLLPEHALDLVAHGSPDFWSWRSGVFVLQPRETAADTRASATLYATGGEPDSDALSSRDAVEAEVARLTELWSERFDSQIKPRELSAAARVAERLVGLYQRLTRFALAEEWRGRAIDLFQRVTADESDPQRRANAWVMLGTLWNESPLGNHAENQRKAIAAYDAALTVYTRERHPGEWAMTQNNLGNAWRSLPTGDRGENLRMAIAAYEAALTVYTRDAYPVNWANTLNNLGVAWGDLPTGDRGENLRRAIAAYEAALTVYTRDAHPVDWAMTQNNLGIAWGDLPTGDRSDNLRRAIAAYEAALTIRTRDAHPIDWAMTQYNRAIALADLAELPGEDRCGGLRQAIACGKAALLIETPEAFPDDHVSTLKNLQIDRAAYESGGCAGDVPFDEIPPAK